MVGQPSFHEMELWRDRVGEWNRLLPTCRNTARQGGRLELGRGERDFERITKIKLRARADTEGIRGVNVTAEAPYYFP